MEFICNDCKTPLNEVEDVFISVDSNKIYCNECKNNHDNVMPYLDFDELDFEESEITFEDEEFDEFDGDNDFENNDFEETDLDIDDINEAELDSLLMEDCDSDESYFDALDADF